MALVDFLNSTTDNYRATKEATDLIYHKRKFLEILRSKGTIKSGVGGIESHVPWETAIIGDAAATSVAEWDGGNIALPAYAQDNLIQSGSFPWRFAYFVTFEVDNELVKNKGAAAWMDITKIRYQGLVKRASRFLEEGFLTLDGSAAHIQGLPSFMNNTDATYGGGLGLTSATYQPKIVAVGATLPNLTLDHINQAWSATADGSDHIDTIIGGPDFLQHMRTLIIPDQVYNQGGGMWSVGPEGVSWFGKVPIQATRYLQTVKKIYGLVMSDYHVEFAWPGDGLKSTGWYALQTAIGTMVMVMKVAVRSFCVNPNDQFMLTYT